MVTLVCKVKNFYKHLLLSITKTDNEGKAPHAKIFLSNLIQFAIN